SRRAVAVGAGGHEASRIRMTRSSGAFALLGGGEWRGALRALDEELAATAAAREVIVLTTAAAFERPEEARARAVAYFDDLGLVARPLPVLHRPEADDPAFVESVKAAKFLYVSDGSPLHLRSVLKGSALFDALLDAHRRGAAIAASGAGATVL